MTLKALSDLKACSPNVPLVFMAGSLSHRIEVRQSDPCVVAVVAKSFDLGAMAGVIEAVLKGRTELLRENGGARGSRSPETLPTRPWSQRPGRASSRSNTNRSLTCGPCASISSPLNTARLWMPAERWCCRSRRLRRLHRAHPRPR